MITFTRKGLIANTFLDDKAIEQILEYQRIAKLVLKHKEIILGCMKQSDANWVYDSDEVIKEFEKLFEGANAESR